MASIIIKLMLIVWVLVMILAVGIKIERVNQTPYIHALKAQANKSHCEGEVTFPMMTGE